MSSYEAFLKAKTVTADEFGFDVDPSEVNPILKPHQRDIVCWAVRRGRAALFEAFGLGKTMQQLEVVRLTLAKLAADRQRNGRVSFTNSPGRGLIVIPLGVRQEFMRDAETLGIEASFIRTTSDAALAGIYLTNYESVREGKVDPRAFDVVSLDEAGILRGFGGTKTFRELMATMAGDDRRDLSNVLRHEGIPYRFVATATPSPNEFIELLAYSAFLGVMDVSAAKTRFFKRNSVKADHLTLHPHKEREFWLWVSTWAVFVQRPSDLGYSDEGYELPPLDVRWHEVPSDHASAGVRNDGQARMLADAALGVVEASREKRASLGARMAKLAEIRAEGPDAHRIIWHDLEDERKAIEDHLPEARAVFGSQPLDYREKLIRAFAEGELQEIAAKPVMLGSGVNFQRHCHWAVFLGIGFKFGDFIQAIHRLQRFLQTETVRIDLIYTEAEREVRATLERKWRQHEELVAQMTGIIREYGLAESAKASALQRQLGVERSAETGNGWTLVHNDSVLECAAMAADSVDLIVTSIPFSTQYEYSPSYNDFGHTDNEAHFWEQMDYLTPNLLRVLKPGRNLVIHCKDRIAPGGLTGFGFQTVQPFHANAIFHYQKHGFAYLGMKTVVTDVVRENNQTYRLGWTEQCKDGTRMGVGMPEYLLLFRRPPSDSSDGYADEPVVKDKAEYSRARWQTDAHGFERSSGDRLLTPEDVRDLKHADIYKLFRAHSLSTVYDYKEHVALAESLEEAARLPVTFQLLPPQSWHPDVWTDVTRMKTLNAQQYAKGKEMHLCPLQFDIVDRVIRQMSNPGEVVFDPFSGLGTVALRAVKLGRRGLGCELSASYHADALYWLRRQDREVAMPSLFDVLGEAVEVAS
jgi:DNA modification methylase